MTVNDFRTFLYLRGEDGQEIQRFIDLALTLSNGHDAAAQQVLSQMRQLIADGYSFNAIRSILRKGTPHAC